MFYNAVSFNQDLGRWVRINVFHPLERNHSHSNCVCVCVCGYQQVSGVDNFRFMFDDAIVFSQNLCPWTQRLTIDQLSSTDVSAMFTGTNCPVDDEVGFVQGANGEAFTAFCYNCSEFYTQNTA